MIATCNFSTRNLIETITNELEQTARVLIGLWRMTYAQSPSTT